MKTALYTRSLMFPVAVRLDRYEVTRFGLTVPQWASALLVLGRLVP